MAGFYYFIELPTDKLAPNGKLDVNVLAGCGLGDVLADCLVVNTDVILSGCESGPGDKPGVVLTVMPVGDETVQYRPSIQTWAEVAGPKSHHWIGWLTDSPPGPNELQRRKQIPGYPVEGASGRHWTIPIARSPAGGSTIPQNIVFAGGKPVPKVKPDFAELWEMSGRVWDLVFNSTGSNEPTAVKDGDLIRIAMVAIGVNYRIGPAEISSLEVAGVPLLDTEVLRDVNLALVDAHTASEFQKKTN